MPIQPGEIHVRSQQTWNSLAVSDPLDAILWGLHTESTPMSSFYESGERRIEQLLKLVDSRGIHFPRERALDFGCGVGRLTAALTTRFDQTWGVDVSDRMIEIATHSVSVPNCEFITLTKPGLGLFDSKYFDFIISLLVLQHIDPRVVPMYINELFRVQKPGGVLILQVVHAPDWSLEGIRVRTVRSLLHPITRFIRSVTNKPEHMLLHGINESTMLHIADQHNATCVSIERTFVKGWQDRQYIFVGGE